MNAPLLAALLCTALCALLFLADSGGHIDLPGLRGWEERSVDVRFGVRGTRSPKDDRIVIVALDDATRRGMPEMWQNRRGFAELIRRVSEAKPRAFGADVFFSSPEINLRQSVVDVVRSTRSELEAAESPSPLEAAAAKALRSVDEETRGDQILSSAVADSEALVLALLFYLGGEPIAMDSPERAGVAKARVDESVYLDQPMSERPPLASGVVAPLHDIGLGTRQMGHVNVRHAKDGMVREAPLIVEAGGRFYQGLALKLASMELGQPTTYVSGDHFVKLGDRTLPVDSQTFARIAYLGGNGTFPRISAVEIMQRSGPHPGLKDKIVLLGYTDAARDKLITPLARQLDGVEMHATLVHNILHGELLRMASPWATLAAILVFGALLSLLQLRALRRRGLWVLGGVPLLLMVAYMVCAQVLFSGSNLVLGVVAPALSLLAITLAALATALATEGREKAELRSAFGQYLQSTVVERLIRDPERLQLGGQRRELTVLFSDIRGFSRFSEKLDPEVLGGFLNEYLTPMTELVMEDAGMLDKYIGDAVMAVYGAPVEVVDHAEKACATALAMQEALIPLNESWSQRGLPEIRIGIGVNSGPMSVGNMGSKRRFDYTVMGDAVNLGARLESLTKSYGVGILVGEATREAASQSFVFREVDRVRVIGRSAAASVFELCSKRLDSTPGASAHEEFAEALGCYREQDWDAADAGFRRVLARSPEDGPAQVLLDRIPKLRRAELGASWDGVFDQQVK